MESTCLNFQHLQIYFYTGLNDGGEPRQVPIEAEILIMLTFQYTFTAMTVELGLW